MEQKLINRINELAQKSKQSGLTAEEAEERDRLRKEYLKQFREGMKKNIMDNLYIVDEKGNKTKVERKK